MLELLAPYGVAPSPLLMSQLQTYLDVLLRWNARTNLTAIRDPERIVERHFGESLFCAAHLPAKAQTALDFGSGAGFPGLPIALARPELQVTLTESQGKKVAFLRELIRELGVSAGVWPKRVEEMPADRRFSVVTMRAVDDSAKAVIVARDRVQEGGVLIQVGGAPVAGSEVVDMPGGVLSLVRC